MDARFPPASKRPSQICDPPGFPRDDLHSLAAIQLVQTPLQVVVLYPRYQHWRVIWADGRELPKDPDPTWDGYSTGKWVDNTTFVVRMNRTDERTLAITLVAPVATHCA